MRLFFPLHNGLGPYVNSSVLNLFHNLDFIFIYFATWRSISQPRGLEAYFDGSCKIVVKKKGVNLSLCLAI